MPHLYSITHEPPQEFAPPRLSTVFSGRECSYEELEKAAEAHAIGKLHEASYWRLEYPKVPPRPVDGLRQVEDRYESCARCHLCDSRTHVVLFRGNPEAKILAIGEGPGKSEDSTGRPFVGRSGRLQDEIFRQVGIDPDEDVGWTNLVSCRPTKNRWEKDRPPTLLEKLACSERLMMTFQAFRPRVVLCLGKQATKIFWDDFQDYNVWRKLRGGPDEPHVTVGIIRHPAYLLRAMMANYKEYYAQKLFLRRLKVNLPNLQKLPAWTIWPKYVIDNFFNEDVMAGCSDGDWRR